MILNQHGLGHRLIHDQRDKLYRAEQVVETVPLTGWKYWYDLAGWNLQGNTARCVGFNGTNYLKDSPKTHDPDDPKLDGEDWYCACCAVDEWSANDNCDQQAGTSVRAFMKVAKSRGYVSTYYNTTDFNTWASWLLTKGPLLLGLTWYNSYWQITWGDDKKGDRRPFIERRESEGIAGGHCLIANAINIERGYARLKLGSWPRTYGVNGRVVMRLDTLEEEIAAGECQLSLEVTGMAQTTATEF